MNDRIRELVKQSTRTVDGGPDMFSMPREVFDKEKFAELIVRECANVAADHDALDIYEEIREHFGVEE